MNRSVFWKLFITAVLLAAAVVAMTPVFTRDFPDFALSEATANKADFEKLLARARERVANHDKAVSGAPRATTIFVGLRDIVNDPAAPVDLQRTFFPHLKLVKEPSLERRNNIVLSHLLKTSESRLKLGLDLQGGVSFSLRIPEKALEGKDAKEMLAKAGEVMSDRVNASGLAEPVIRSVGRDTLEIQLAGAGAANDPEIINRLKKPSILEMRMVNRFEHPTDAEPDGFVKILKDDPNDITSPSGRYEALSETKVDKTTGDRRGGRYFIKVKADVAGKDISHAAGEPAPGDLIGDRWHTSISFTSDGSKHFEEITGKIADSNNRYGDGAQMGIVLDGKLVQAVGVKPDDSTGRWRAIAGGSASIDASGEESAKELANVLNNPLEFPLDLLDQQVVGPSLAKDAQSKSVIAVSVAIALVVAFMVAYYLSAGAIAVVAVIVNVVMILGVLAAMHATITLPGVAALVLTIGMAVDANILVFERIREEIAGGASLHNALAAGYSRALATILDANITTLLTAGILIWMGAGPIRGFGVTLAVGIVTTVFTALITTRGLQELAVNTGLFTHIFGVRFFPKEAKFRFMDHARKVFTLSWCVIGLGIVAITVRGHDSLGKDFRGGEAVLVEVAEGKRLDTGEITKIAAAAGVADTTPVYATDLSGSKTTLRIDCELSPGGAFANADKVVAALVAKHPEAFPAGKKVSEIITGRESIGATVSDSLQVNAILSIVFALIGILVYVALRFEVGMGLGAMVATLHDVLMTAGLYVVYGWIFGGGQASAAMVAAMLMIIGYSINDTIVVFDRIREELESYPAMSLRDVIHIAINRTLSRTILTALTVFLTAVALFVFGAGDVKEYGLVFIFGVLTGTVSSIFIASPVFYWWHKGDRRNVEKADAPVKYEWQSEAKAVKK